ncbi:MAG: 50S ribosomal protein L10 [Clostridia bacterium]|nr:50S ribosomal protein L10 [Clostridia bacterium]
MASEKILEQKKKQVSELADQLTKSAAGVIVDYSGVNVTDDTILRRKLRENDVAYKVVKNSILKRAFEAAKIEGFEDAVFEGNSAIAISDEDTTAPARFLHDFAKEHKNFKLKAGYAEGAVLTDELLKRYATLPSKEILLATVCNAFNAPIAAFARVIQALVDKNGEEAPAAETAE